MLMQMADLSAVQIRSLVDETDIGKIRAGMGASVSVVAYPNQPFPGDVLKIEPQAVVEQNVTMFAVLISIQNPDGLLMPGMNAEVSISIARTEDALTIPVMALRTSRDLASTASVLGRSEEDISNALGETAPSMEKPEGGRPANARPGGQRGGQGRQGRSGRQSGSDAATDYRFGGDFWVVMDSAEQEIRKVRTGITDLDRVEIISGLDEGDRVLILPSSHLLQTQQDLQNFINRRRSGVPGIN